MPPRRTRNPPGCPPQYVCRTYKTTIAGHAPTAWNMFVKANKGLYKGKNAMKDLSLAYQYSKRSIPVTRF